MYLPYLSYSLHIKYSFCSFIHIKFCVLLNKATAIDSLQTQGLGARLPQHCRAVLEEGHPLWRGTVCISQARKGDPPRVQHRKHLDECCCQTHAHFRIYLSSSLYQCKFLPHISHLHLLSGKVTISIRCWEQNFQSLLQLNVFLTTVAKRC